MGALLGRVAAAFATALVSAVAKYLESQAKKLETQSAVKSAAAAKTVDELREASRRLTNATNRA